MLQLGSTARALVAGCVAGVLCSCMGPPRDGPPRFPVDVSKIPNAKPRHEPKSRYGNPPYYQVHGKRYRVLSTSRGYHKKGIASWYGRKFHGKLTSSRERYDMLAMTGASPELPIPCYVRVTNLHNHRTVVVRINDRGPFATHRILDLSFVAAKKLGYANKGTALVQVDAINLDPLQRNAPMFAQYLQVGAFRDKEHALQLKRFLAQTLLRPVRISTHYPSDTPFRVLVGPIQNSHEAQSVRAHLARSGLRAFRVISQGQA